MRIDIASLMIAVAASAGMFAMARAFDDWKASLIFLQVSCYAVGMRRARVAGMTKEETVKLADRCFGGGMAVTFLVLFAAYLAGW